MTQTITFWEGDERFETECTPYECGANWMHGILVDGDERDLYAWWAVDSFEWEQALVNANAPCFPAFEDSDMAQEAERGAWDTLQRRVADCLVDLYNDGKDETCSVRWDRADEEFIDPDAGEWKPYLLQTWDRDLIATFEDVDELVNLLTACDTNAVMEARASAPDTGFKADRTWYETWLSYGKEPEA